jgi:hypothetical protein
VFAGVDAQRFERIDVQVKNVCWCGFKHNLILVIVLQTVWVFAVSPVFWAARGLNVGRAPGLGPNGTQEGRGVRGAGTDFHIVGLQQGAALLVPIVLERQDNLLKREHERKPKTGKIRKKGFNFSVLQARGAFKARREAILHALSYGLNEAPRFLFEA